MPEFLKVITPDEVIAALSDFPRSAIETEPLNLALNRICGKAIVSLDDLPPQPRSTMDGFALRASDSFGATDAIPALFSLAGAVTMGRIPDFSVGARQAAAIPTGGFLPPGADAVVMIEYTNPVGQGEIEVIRPVTAGENILAKAEDTAQGDIVIPKGRRLRPQEIGLLAGLGIVEIPIYRKPRVAVLSTGDEIVPITEAPLPGKIRDINAHSLAALCREVGAEAVGLAILPDDPHRLRAAIESALETTDVVVLSGGSSVGERDHMMGAVTSLPEVAIRAHGVAISPGKPTLIASVGGKPLFGLSGHPVSAFVVAQVFLAPFLRYLQGEPLAKGPAGPRLNARLAVSIHSVQGCEEYVRVRIETASEVPIARPVYGKSGIFSTLVKADGIFVVPIHAEGVPAGEAVEVILY
ncbi:MAG: molybdopterin molybdotransferase MoeA [Syntrophaceae bacterium]|nr:molybdopterin molybdotransferase MoeA [Syntrophaceae bacterium]